MGLGPRGGLPARPWGQRIGSNDKHNEWKLFIGQVPLEVSPGSGPCLFNCIQHLRTHKFTMCSLETWSLVL